MELLEKTKKCEKCNDFGFFIQEEACRVGHSLYFCDCKKGEQSRKYMEDISDGCTSELEKTAILWFEN